VKIIADDHSFIDYRLKFIGIRVRSDSAQKLICDNEGRWKAIGPTSPLPIALQSTPEKANLITDSLRVVVHSYMVTNPQSDLESLVTGTGTFANAVLSGGGAIREGNEGEG
jgi:hypothetical protein